MSVPVVRRLSVVCVAAAALFGSADASAQHFYGILVNENVPDGDADQGSWIQILTDRLFSPGSGDFVNHEMWYGVVAGGASWVEVGFKSEPIRSVQLVRYDREFTFDILPASQTGTYFAAGLQIGSTLR